MTTFTNEQLDNILGGNAARLSEADALRALTAAAYQACQANTARARGPFPSRGSLPAMVDHTAREQQDQLACARKFPL